LKAVFNLPLRALRKSLRSLRLRIDFYRKGREEKDAKKRKEIFGLNKFSG
jgi:hypothetical protein